MNEVKEKVKEKEESMMSSDRERCSYNKGHKCPTMKDYKDDLYHWWLEYACRGDYDTIGNVSCAIGRLRDYIEGYDENYQDGNPYGFPEDLGNERRLCIVYYMLEKMSDALDKLQERTDI